MTHDTGFAHFVVTDDFNNEFLLLGSEFLEEDNIGEAPVLLENHDGQAVSVCKRSFQSNYNLSTKIRIAESWTGVLTTLTPLSPVFISYKGMKVMLVGVAQKASAPDGRRYAIYQKLEDGEIYSMSIDEFYDMFSLISEVGVTRSPFSIDESGKLGYIANRGAFNKDKFPNMRIEVNAEAKYLSIIE